jgi:hypothetical protein
MQSNMPRLRLLKQLLGLCGLPQPRQSWLSSPNWRWRASAAKSQDCFAARPPFELGTCLPIQCPILQIAPWMAWRGMGVSEWVRSESSSVTQAFRSIDELLVFLWQYMYMQCVARRSVKKRRPSSPERRNAKESDGKRRKYRNQAGRYQYSHT